MADVSPIDVQKALHGVEYPTSKDALVRAAEGNGAEGAVLEAVNGIADKEYGAPTEVSAEIFD
ncbi:DUF2795 domain-containing protein [Kineococcus sp. SYSU DK003]|uniref:DUF2795 domain-containing protein n=1 Tax=Kineococcus sp. SYSU DK003 TaxID=3383124 RepID=UPI003D7EF8B7